MTATTELPTDSVHIHPLARPQTDLGLAIRCFGKEGRHLHAQQLAGFFHQFVQILMGRATGREVGPGDRDIGEAPLISQLERSHGPAEELKLGWRGGLVEGVESPGGMDALGDEVRRGVMDFRGAVGVSEIARIAPASWAASRLSARSATSWNAAENSRSPTRMAVRAP